MPDTALVAVGVAISTVVLQALLSWLAWWVLTGPGDLTHQLAGLPGRGVRVLDARQRLHARVAP